MNLVKSAGARLYDFWLQPKPATGLALFRIFFGMLVLQYALVLGANADLYFGPQAIVSPAAAQDFYHSPHLNVFDWLSAGQGQLSCARQSITVLVLAALGLTCGFCTTVSAMLVYMLLAAAQFSAPFVVHSGEILLRLTAFYLMFSPAGAEFSLDRAIRLKMRKARMVGGAAAPVQANLLFSPWARRLIQLQITVVYAQACFSKLGSSLWLSGDAVWYTVHNLEFQRFALPFLTHSLIACKLLTWFTILAELSMCTLVWWKPTRYLALSLGMILHLGLEYTLNIPFYQALMVFSYITFIDDEDLKRLLAWLKLKLSVAFRLSGQAKRS